MLHSMDVNKYVTNYVFPQSKIALNLVPCDWFWLQEPKVKGQIKVTQLRTDYTLLPVLSARFVNIH